MAESKKSMVVIICSIVGCVVTLLTCGTLIGNMQGDVRSLAEDTSILQSDVKTLSASQTDMKSKQAYLEGVVSTKLDTIQTTVTKIGLQVDDLIRAE